MPKPWWLLAPPSCRAWTWPLCRHWLEQTRAPILAGPFTGELGFESLYWIPFLNRLRDRGLAGDRLIPITRGGAGVWYDTPRSVELLDMRDVAEVRIENRRRQQQTGRLKQETVSPWDRAVTRDAAARLRLTRYHVLSPAWLYHTCRPFWEGRWGLDRLRPSLAFKPLPVPSLPAGVVLPQTFVAVRFYFRATFPVQEALMTFAQATVTRLASQVPVLLLNTPIHSDEHFDWWPKPAIANVAVLSDLTPMTPQTHLAVVSAVLGRAAAFVGTYGGLAQLAVRFGRPSVSFYHHWAGTSVAHKHLADAVALQFGVPCHVLPVTDALLLHQVLAPVIFQQTPPKPGGTTGLLPAPSTVTEPPLPVGLALPAGVV